MTETLSVTTQSISCSVCGITFSAPYPWVKERRDDHATFWCPNGHDQYFGRGESEEERLQRQLKAVRESADRGWRAYERAQRSAAAHKGQVTRIKRRVASGQCPCCRQQFADLHAHMSEQHPDYGGEEDA